MYPFIFLILCSLTTIASVELGNHTPNPFTQQHYIANQLQTMHPGWVHCFFKKTQKKSIFNKNFQKLFLPLIFYPSIIGCACGALAKCPQLELATFGKNFKKLFLPIINALLLILSHKKELTLQQRIDLLLSPSVLKMNDSELNYVLKEYKKDKNEIVWKNRKEYTIHDLFFCSYLIEMLLIKSAMTADKSALEKILSHIEWNEDIIQSTSLSTNWPDKHRVTLLECMIFCIPETTPKKEDCIRLLLEKTNQPTIARGLTALRAPQMTNAIYQISGKNLINRILQFLSLSIPLIAALFRKENSYTLVVNTLAANVGLTYFFVMFEGKFDPTVKFIESRQYKLANVKNSSDILTQYSTIAKHYIKVISDYPFYRNQFCPNKILKLKKHGTDKKNYWKYKPNEDINQETCHHLLNSRLIPAHVRKKMLKEILSWDIDTSYVGNSLWYFEWEIRHFTTELKQMPEDEVLGQYFIDTLVIKIPYYVSCASIKEKNEKKEFLKEDLNTFPSILKLALHYGIDISQRDKYYNETFNSINNTLNETDLTEIILTNPVVDSSDNLFKNNNDISRKLEKTIEHLIQSEQYVRSSIVSYIDDNPKLKKDLFSRLITYPDPALWFKRVIALELHKGNHDKEIIHEHIKWVPDFCNKKLQNLNKKPYWDNKEKKQVKKLTSLGYFFKSKPLGNTEPSSKNTQDRNI